MPEKINDKLLVWGRSGIEEGAIQQAERTSRLPFIAGHVALMPDAHWGMGSTVGSVIPTRGAIIPAAIGVDIGCGMIAGLTNLTASDLPDDLSWLHSEIAKRVPAGVGQGGADSTYQTDLFDELPFVLDDRLQKKAVSQLGSLGSGNHFVEVCLDETERVWVVLHSGSRGVGNEIAKIHIEGARQLMKRYFIELEDRDLAYLVQGTPEFKAYINDMLWAQRYAMENRDRMLYAVMEALHREVPKKTIWLTDTINCHHNYTELEQHGGKPTWVTRKGAVRAREGDRGVIPGSMGAASYIVSGLGNLSSYNSCAHGAGRAMGRKQAERTLSADSLFEAMAGKTWNRNSKLLDEHPDAYKDIDEVMEAQKDLVRIDHTLHQVLNYKGT